MDGLTCRAGGCGGCWNNYGGHCRLLMLIEAAGESGSPFGAVGTSPLASFA
ncbi:MAG: hypothetical protein ACT4PT_03915 [Methanobacteriota archaeon]